MKIIYRITWLLNCACLLGACSGDTKTLFTRLSDTETGIDFRNLLKEDNELFNVTIYPYFYNGAGVAVGDIDNDGLPDICFTGNMVKNRLYINKGNFRFEDITTASGIAKKEGWCTGVSMVDINNDGWLDIYICRSGYSSPALRRNLLFINNHDHTFTERAAAYGIDDPGYSTQASFFDYDKDGDLDLFVANHASYEFSPTAANYLELKRDPEDSLLQNKLFRNDNGHFQNVSAIAGIHSNKMTFSLGAMVSDLDMDGWPDIYVTNDFKESDYLYINNHDGTFSERLKEKTSHTSLYAMGCDAADYNNDALPDIIVPDMLPESDPAQKMHVAADNYNAFRYLFGHGMHPQFVQNTLQKNLGGGKFTEIGQFAGVSSTDWSWAPLFADLDNDGWKDLFISNGYKRDNTDVDFIMYSADQTRKQRLGQQVTIPEFIAHMQPILLPNYVFRNTGTDHFENVVAEWGLQQQSISNGAAYADLDNDGDLDLVVNNIDDPAGIYRNNGTTNHSLRLKLRGTVKNPDGIGAKIFVYSGGQKMYVEQQPVRGFQSSVDRVLCVGIGKSAAADSVRIVWPDDRTQLLLKLAAGNTTISAENAHEDYHYEVSSHGLFAADPAGPLYHHTDDGENDFNRQSLLMRSYAHFGPAIAKADIDHNGLEDIFIGGPGPDGLTIFLQQKDGRFTARKIAGEPVHPRDAIFFDANADGYADLYLLGDGYRDTPEKDHLLLNDGHGNLKPAALRLPDGAGTRSCVRPADVDGDGDPDLFIGGGPAIGRWPEASPSMIYFNDGHGNFSPAGHDLLEPLRSLGIVTDAAWLDVNRDGNADLVVCGEWMAPQVFLRHGAGFEPPYPLCADQKGWWNRLLVADFDHDGDSDIVIGNFGLNSLLGASAAQPVQLFAADIDKNGSLDPIVTYYSLGKRYPFAGMDDIVGQVPALKKKFYDYSVYTTAGLTDIFADTSKLVQLSCETLASTYFENAGGKFTAHVLPDEMQFAPVYALAALDADRDGNPDFVAFGNDHFARIRIGACDSNKGFLFCGDGKGGFHYVDQIRSGLDVEGDVRSAITVSDRVVVGVNGDSVMTVRAAVR